MLAGHASWNEMPMELKNGIYPFAGELLPLTELTMVEAPTSLQQLLVDQATRNGLMIVRDEPVELRCQLEGHGELTFVVYWRTGDERMHMLVPNRQVTGRA